MSVFPACVLYLPEQYSRTNIILYYVLAKTIGRLDNQILSKG